MATLIQYGDGATAIEDSLRRRILSGELEIGQALKIQALAADYGVSAMPVREALRTLAAEGLVDIRPRRSPLVARPRLSEILEINAIRRALEPLALAEAIPRHDKRSLADCRRILSEDRACKDRWKKAELNRRFHLALLAPSGMARVLRTIEEQYGAIALFAQVLVVKSTKLIGATHGEHSKILAAVEKRDSALALGLLGQHIEASTARLEKALELVDGEAAGAGTEERASGATGRPGPC